MTSTVQELSVVCKWYEELIGLCEAQIATIRNCENTRSLFLIPGENRDELEEDSTINIDSSSLNKIRFQELSNVILRCSDADFLDVLRSELERQRDFHRKRIQQLQTSKVQFKVNITTAPLQSFFKNSVYNADGDVITKYYHFEGENIAREIHVNNNQSPSLLITGRDDSKMCPLKLTNAKETLQLSEESILAETEFNCLWSQHGGLPYVRQSRLARRNLMSALSKINKV